MSKKLLAVMLSLLLLFTLCSCGADQPGSEPPAQTETEDAEASLDSTMEETDVESDITLSNPPSIGEPTYLGLIPSPKRPEGKLYASDFESLTDYIDANTQFMFLSEAPDGKMSVFSIAKEDFWQIYWDADNSDLPSDYSRTEIEYALRGPEVLLTYFTQKEGFVMADVPGEPLFLTSFVTSDFSAFGGDPIIDSEGSHVAYFEKQGLSIKFENIEPQCYIGSEYMAGSGWEIGSIVKADVTCQKNEGKYKNLSWIPEKGETKSIELVLLYSAYNLPEEVRGIQLNDFFVIGG